MRAAADSGEPEEAANGMTGSGGREGRAQMDRPGTLWVVPRHHWAVAKWELVLPRGLAHRVKGRLGDPSGLAPGDTTSGQRAGSKLSGLLP